jgi:iron complex outermembrane receptor protein
LFIDPDGISAPCAKPANVGNADVSGVELEVEWYVTEDFLIDGSFSTLDFEYTSVDAAALTGSVIAPLNMITPYTPELKWALGLQYGFDLSDGARFNIRLDSNYQDEVYTSATNDSFNLIDDYTLTNAKVWWESPDGDWEIAIQVLNLTDELYYHTIFDQHLSVGQVQAQPALPRTWFTSATKRF